MRIDTGVVEGGEISMFYDPMIAKLCTCGAGPRRRRSTRMRDALDGSELEGIGHNLPFLAAVMDHPRFREGRLSTGFIAEEYPDGFAGDAVAGRDPGCWRRSPPIAIESGGASATASGTLSATRAVAAGWVVAIPGHEIWPGSRNGEEVASLR